MRNGICPKCGSQNIYTNTEIGPVSNVYGVQAIPVRGALKTEFARLVTYVCAVCGYAESYVQGSHSIAEITRHWKKVEAQS